MFLNSKAADSPPRETLSVFTLLSLLSTHSAKIIDLSNCIELYAVTPEICTLPRWQVAFHNSSCQVYTKQCPHALPNCSSLIQEKKKTNKKTKAPHILMLQEVSIYAMYSVSVYFPDTCRN